MNAPPGRRTGLNANVEAGRGSKAGGPTNENQHTRTGPAIGGRVVVNARCSQTWSFEDDRRVARVIEDLEVAPAGADVVVVVRRRQHPSLALDYLRTHGGHLGSITVECSDPETVARWVRGLRDGVAVTRR